MRKLAAILFTLLIGSMSIFGCAPSGPDDSGDPPDPPRAKETLPDYLNKNERTFQIGMWTGVARERAVLDTNGKVTGSAAWTDGEFLEQYRWIQEAGFTIASPPQGNPGTQHMLRMLDAAEAVGIKQLVWDESVNSVLLNLTLSDSDAQAQARRLLVEYSDHEAYIGSMITDEPQMREYDALSAGHRRYKALLPDKMYYLNLFPVIATSLQLGTDSYETYLSTYVSKVTGDYLCYDHYPLQRTGTLAETFLWNMELAQDQMQKTGGEVWTFLQSMGFGSMKDPDRVEEFRVQAAASLAYGVKGIQWFCYCSPEYGGVESFTPAIITLDGKKTAKYDMVKAVNNEILAFDDVYLNFTWKRAMNFIGSENTQGKNNAFEYVTTDNKHERIKTLTSTRDLVAGVFADGENRDGFMFVNYDNPSSASVNKLNVKFANCTEAVVYVNGARREVAVTNGEVSLDLRAGDWAYVIPLNI